MSICSRPNEENDHDDAYDSYEYDYSDIDFSDPRNFTPYHAIDDDENRIDSVNVSGFDTIEDALSKKVG